MPSEKRVRLTGAQIWALLALPWGELQHALLLLRLPLFPRRRAPLALRLTGARIDALMSLPEAELRKDLVGLMESLGDDPPILKTSDWCGGCRAEPPIHIAIDDDFSVFLSEPEDHRAVQGDPIAARAVLLAGALADVTAADQNLQNHLQYAAANPMADIAAPLEAAAAALQAAEKNYIKLAQWDAAQWDQVNPFLETIE